MNDLKFTTAGDYMKKPPMLEKFAAQSLVEYNGELIFSKEKFAELILRECALLCSDPVTILQHWGIDSESK